MKAKFIKGKFSKIAAIPVLVIIVTIAFFFINNNINKVNIKISSDESNSSNYGHFGRFMQYNDDFIFSYYDYDSESSGMYYYSKREDMYNKLNEINAFYLSVYNDMLYYIDIEERTLNKSEINNGNSTKIVNATDYILDPSTGYIYYTHFEERSPVYRLDNEGESTIIYDKFATNFIIDNNYLYFNNDDDFSIYRVDLNTLEVEQIIKKNVDKYIVKNEEIFYNSKKLYKLNLSTLEEEVIIDDTVNSFLINNDRIFYLTSDLSKEKGDILVILDMSGETLHSIKDERLDARNNYLYSVNNTIYIAGTFETYDLLILDTKNLKFNKLEP